MADSISMGVRFRLTDDLLILDYEVRNQSNLDAYLLNRLYKSNPSWSMTADIIYVHLDVDRRAVHLSKKLADIPTGVTVTAPVAPFVTPVRAGDQFSETVRVPIPIESYLQYLSQQSDADGQAFFSSVDFELGYYWRTQGGTEEVRDINGSEVVLPRSAPGMRTVFGTLSSESVPLELPVLLPVTEPGE